MARAKPDFGSLKVWRGRFGEPARPAVCVSLFAANDPESSAAALAQVRKKLPWGERPLAGALSLREDRGDRTAQWVEAAGQGFFRDFAHVVLVGPPARAALRRILKAPSPGPTAFSCLSNPAPEALMRHILAAVGGEPVVVGLGNIVGPGERVVDYWQDRGSPYDH